MAMPLCTDRLRNENIKPAPMEAPTGTQMRRLNRKLHRQESPIGAGPLQNHEGLVGTPSFLCGMWATNNHEQHTVDITSSVVAKFITENLEGFNCSEGAHPRTPRVVCDLILQMHIPVSPHCCDPIPKRSRLTELLDESDSADSSAASEDEDAAPHDG